MGGAVLWIQAGFFIKKRLVMAVRLEIMDDQSESENDEDAGNDIRDDCLENEQLIDAEKGDEAA